MRLDKTPEKLKEMDEQLGELQEARDEYHTLRNGFMHYNMPDQVVDIKPYIGAEVTEDEFLEAGYRIVETLVEADKIFETLRNAKIAFSKLDDDIEVRGKTAEQWQHEINEYVMERRHVVEDVFELSEPINESDEVDFDISLEYWNRVEDIDHLMLDDE